MKKVDPEKSSAGMIFDIQRYSINDGPGIRTTVFFKGCPLRCRWCSNPESIRKMPQLLFLDSLCTRCHRCEPVCTTGATGLDRSGGSIRIDRKLCKACGRCVEVCASGARVISGRRMRLSEVIEVVKKDALFYRTSGGGVTASGGEPTAQPQFLMSLFRWCQANNIATTLDTCGYVRWDVLNKILDYTELVLFDIKHMDSDRHVEYTGKDNTLILENALRIARRGHSMRLRMPLIPGLNDGEKNIRSVAAFLRKLGLSQIDLLPYHRLGTNKYQRLGQRYSLNSMESYKKERLEEVKKIFQSLEIEALIA